MPYVDGFVLLVPEDKLDAYREMAETAAKVWIEHGALDYHECVGDDLKAEFGVPFTELAKPQPGELVIFSWIMYESKEKRDEINAKVMQDPRIKDSCDPDNMPFDTKRMTYGGFKTIVDMQRDAAISR
jgi:uncharacterized protein YbaA (DUF1428 family)